jgi:hypothetical protein
MVAVLACWVIRIQMELVFRFVEMERYLGMLAMTEI